MKNRVMGVITLTYTDCRTGKSEVDVIKNMVADVGVETMWRRVSMLDETNQFQLGTIHLGDDLGGERWTIFNPEPPTREFTQENQNVTYVIPSVTYEFPTDDFLRATAFIDGTTLLNENFPAEIDYRFTSMSLRFNNGEIFAYKRFPIRSISRFVSVTIDWRFRIVNDEEWCEIPEDMPIGDDVLFTTMGVIGEVTPDPAAPYDKYTYFGGTVLNSNIKTIVPFSELADATETTVYAIHQFPHINNEGGQPPNIYYSDDSFVFEIKTDDVPPESITVEVLVGEKVIHTEQMFVSGTPAQITDTDNTQVYVGTYYNRKIPAPAGVAQLEATYPATYHNTPSTSPFALYVGKNYKLVVKKNA